MGRLIAVVALAGATAVVAAHPGSSSRARAARASVHAAPAPAPSASVTASTSAAERDFARRQAEVALSGSAPLFGAEGLPKPLK